LQLHTYFTTCRLAKYAKTSDNEICHTIAFVCLGNPQQDVRSSMSLSAWLLYDFACTSQPASFLSLLF